METIKTIEQGIDLMLAKSENKRPKYEFKRIQSDADRCETLSFGGKDVPLLWWRHHEKYDALHDFDNFNPGSNCCINGFSFTTKDEPLERLLFREFDIVEWILHSETEKVTAFRSGDAINLIAVMKNGTVANMDFAATMPIGAEPQMLHRLITTTGMASDRVVDTVTVQHAINLYADTPDVRHYTDLESWLYGLSPDDVNKTLCAFWLLIGKESADGFIKTAEHLRKTVAAALKSAKEETTVRVED